MKKIKHRLILFFCLQSAIFCFLFLGHCLSSAEEFLVAEVIDGDTIKLASGEIVRYLGIDTSELRWYKGGSWVYHPQPFANEAKNCNISLVEGKKVKLEFDQEKKDKQKRLLAYVYADNLFVNAEILRQGYALLDIRAPNLRYSEQLAESYCQAKKEKIGIWEEATEEVISPLLAGNFSGKIKTIEGVVREISVRSEIIKLVLDDNEKKEFAIIFYKNNLVLFQQKGINPQKDYLRKKIRASGLIREYKKGFEIIVHHPAEIEIIE